MTVFIALLRGINVGGKNRIKMADLKKVFESIGLIRVETYIQSGNVIFESDEDEDTLRMKTEREIEEKFGFSVIVVLRTAAELEQLILNCPFTEEEIANAESLNSEGESLYVNLLMKAAAQDKTKYLNHYQSENDVYKIINRDIYLLLRHSIRNSKLADSFQKLDVPCTVRNWKTIHKLQILAKSRKDKS